ncbi:MAG: hypothetical protein ABUT39_03565 [Acidobacteriota bacterium]
MQIAFLTLFLGLTLGAYPVELAVEGPVASVDLLLDGAAAGRIAPPKGSPWKGQVDFGAGLLPHELVARGLDEAGQEVARTRQWVNLPRPAAEVGIVLEGPAAKPTRVRITWQSRTGERPVAARVTLDDKPLSPDQVGRSPLPPYDPEAPHVLSAELTFPSNVTARRDVVFGGRYGAELSTELTAVPVRLRQGRMPAPQALAGWLEADGRALTVAAVDEGPGEVVIVRDLGPGVAEALEKLGDDRLLRAQDGTAALTYKPIYQKDMLALGNEATVRFVWPVSSSYGQGALKSELFPQSRVFSVLDGGLHWVLTSVQPNHDQMGKGPQRLADAVAVAGLQAMAGNGPRAVVLLVGPNPEDRSRYDPATVRRYLAAIRVPLFVWKVGEGPVSGALSTAWGDAEDVSTLPGLRAAFAGLKGELGSQRIVWVEGTHLPQAISLSPAAQGLELP